MQFLQLVLIAGVTFLVIDMLWLGVLAKNLYKKELGPLLLQKPNTVAASIFYILYVLALVFFVILPAVTSGNWQYALFAGGFWGLVAYGTYDLTNLATLKNWPVKIVIIDMAWGAIVSGVTCLVTYAIWGHFFNA
ncbi:MAG TPA: DUF2177 family protein [Candidatus Saccharimonadales bacterium]